MITALSALRKGRNIMVGRRHVTPVMAGLVMYWIMILFAAFVAGMILGKGIIVLDVLLFAAFFGILMICLPLEWLVTGLLAAACVVAPSVQYFFGVKQASFIAPALAIVVVAKMFLNAALERKRNKTTSRPEAGNSFILWAVYAYLATILISLIVNRPPTYQALLALKFYYPFWAVFFAIAMGFLSRDFVVRMWRWLIPLALIQLPFTVYQHFVIAPTRPDAATQNAADCVVGTFGGDPMAGGNSGTLMIFLIAGMVIATALNRSGRISRKFMLFTLAISFVSLMMGETKAAFILLPFAFFVFDLRLILARPARLIGIIAIGGPALVGMYKAYQVMYWGEDTRPTYASSSSSSPLHHFDYILDPTNYDLKTGAVDRGAALAIWWADPQADFHRRMIGYGPLASRSQGFVAGIIAKRYRPLEVAATTAATLLWDVGIIGTFTFTAILLGTVLIGLRHLGTVGSDEERQIVSAATGIATTLLVTVVYSPSLLTDGATQLLMMVCAATIHTFPPQLVPEQRSTRTPHRSRTSSHSFTPGRHRLTTTV